ncbi:sodium-coupled monocarboxylate transporter 1 [Hyalella azteca]|uniref:Sodium-coupled monocarboxylate transporter 1 n=1 Tax=Hyalella azteca TaxID=294128 RepID=A0A8B7N5S4_HYAAZ|nr:sodium-coupled monocarboxylate transporter 1 [Hyalella azteca]
MDYSKATSKFGVVDYCVFTVMLVGSLGIGFFHCLRGKNTTHDFLLAGRSMSPWPIALSLTATFISSISILGYVGEVYGHGIQLMWSLVGNFLGVVVAAKVFAPIIYNMKLESVNQYLEQRFGSPMLKKLVMSTSSLSSLFYLGLCLYAPTLALESVTPFSSNTYIVLLGMVVTVYSSCGGMKAVVWTDAFQTLIIILGVIVATICAVVFAGGPAAVWSVASEHGRTQGLDFRMGLHVRHTVFNVIMMSFMNFLGHFSFNQSTVQRLGTMPTLDKVSMVLYLNLFGLLALQALLFFCGMAIFAVYAGCDPITLGFISTKDQILPYYVLDYLGYLQGVPGLFVACLISGTMSSISSQLNTVPTMLWIDFLSQIEYFKQAPQRIQTLATKILTFTMGLGMMGLAFVAAKMGGLIQATATLLSILNGPTMGVFLLGFCVPFCNFKGAMAGVFSSVTFMAWLSIGMQMYGGRPEMLPLHISQCPVGDLNATLSDLSPATPSSAVTLDELSDEPEMEDSLAGFYGISYTFLSAIGMSVCVVVGSVVSLLTGGQDMEELDPEFVLPCLRKYVSRKSKLQETELKKFLNTSTSFTAEKSLEQKLTDGHQPD